MVAGDFRNLIKPSGFRPFRLVMSSGREYDVRHPEMAKMTRTTLFVFTPTSDGPMGRPIYCSLLHVTNVEFLDDRSMPPPGSADAARA